MMRKGNNHFLKTPQVSQVAQRERIRSVNAGDAGLIPGV